MFDTLREEVAKEFQRRDNVNIAIKDMQYDIDHNRQKLAMIEQELADQVGIIHSAKVTLSDSREFKAAVQ